MKIPEIRIYYSWLLHENISVHLDKQLNDGSWKMDEDPELLRTYAGNYQKEWDKYGPQILKKLCEVTGLEFYKSVIDVPCAHWFRAQSDPLTMSFYYFPDQFIDVLTHELCHVLLTDNTRYSDHSSSEWIDLGARWKKLFGEHEQVTTIHIPVHALCKYIYLDVLKDPSRVVRDMDDVKNNKPYIDSWKYVNEHDYMEIIEKLKNDYKDMQVS